MRSHQKTCTLVGSGHGLVEQLKPNRLAVESWPIEWLDHREMRWETAGLFDTTRPPSVNKSLTDDGRPGSEVLVANDSTRAAHATRWWRELVQRRRLWVREKKEIETSQGMRRKEERGTWLATWRPLSWGKKRERWVGIGSFKWGFDQKFLNFLNLKIWPQFSKFFSLTLVQVSKITNWPQILNFKIPSWPFLNYWFLHMEHF